VGAAKNALGMKCVMVYYVVPHACGRHLNGAAAALCKQYEQPTSSWQDVATIILINNLTFDI
jgi:hypothetical protein